jgi:hypothetical protein
VGLDLRALSAHRVFDGTTRDRAGAVTSNLDDEPRDDGRLFLQRTGGRGHELGLLFVVFVVGFHSCKLSPIVSARQGR